MKRQIYIILSAVAMLLTVTSCGGKKHFNVEGTIAGMGSQPIYAFYQADNRVATDTIEVIKDRYKFEGSSAVPTVVELYNRAGTLLGRFIAQNGDKFQANIQPGAPESLTFKDSEANAALMKFLADNPAKSRNKAIAKYVKANPSDIVAAALLRCYYDPTVNTEEAARLVAMISDDNHPIVADLQMMLTPFAKTKQKVGAMTLSLPGDSVVTVKPAKMGYTLLCFDHVGTIADTITDSVAKQYKKLSAKLTINHIRMRTDTVNWWRLRKHFPSSVTCYWAPEAEATASLGSIHIDRYPLFLLVDSLGNQLHRYCDIFDVEIPK